MTAQPNPTEAQDAVIEAEAVVEAAKAQNLPAAISEAPAADPMLAMIERAARDPAVDVDKMERLFAMRERIVAQQAKVAYTSALARLQPTLPEVQRNGKIVIHDKVEKEKVIQSTPYALWEDINQVIKPRLAAEGFALSFRVGQAQDGKITVTGILSHREGHQEETTLSLQYDSTGSKNAVQSAGSSISYGKRYTAGMLLNFTSRMPEEADDDGKKGGDPTPINDDQLQALHLALAEAKRDIDKFCAFFKIEALSDLPATKFDDAMGMIRKVAKKAEQVQG